MNQENQGNTNDVPVTMPVKRKRGRPRKDQSLKHTAQVPSVSCVVQINQRPQLNSMENADDSIVGQQITGVVEASFDAGYLLNVKIGNTNTTLRGVVFKTGHYLPLSAENDVAPHVQMIKRDEGTLQIGKQAHGYPLHPLSEEKSEQTGNVSNTGNGQLLNESSSQLTTSKGKEVSPILPFSVPLRGTVKPVVLEPIRKSNGVSQNAEKFESEQNDPNGVLRADEVNKRVEISSQSSGVRVDNSVEGGKSSVGDFSRGGNGDDVNKPLDVGSLQFMHSGNNNQSGSAPKPSDNSKLGKISAALQVNVSEPGASK